MKLVFKVAKTELRNLFFSPVAWFLTIVFMVTCAIFYTDSVVDFANRQDSMIKTMPAFDGFRNSLTYLVFTIMGNGVVSNIFRNIYLFIPLLTMGLINREFNNGTFKLLYSSPVKVSQIVWGKYLAILLYNLILASILLMFILVGNFSIKDLDLGNLGCVMIAFYLVVSTYTAIGMFMSSISSYSIVSAVATFIMLSVLNLIGLLWQEKDFFREITYFLSINGRTEKMIAGLLTSRDVIYFLLITLLFVAFTYLNLKHGRESVSRVKKMVRYFSVFIIVVTAGYFTSQPGYVWYWDSTRQNNNTIKPVTQDILAKMQDGPLEVTLYTNLLGNGFNETRPRNRNKYVWEVWDRFVRFKPDIKLNYVLYYDVKDGDSSLYKSMPNKSLDSIAKTYAKMMQVDYSRFLKPAEIRSQIDLQGENLRAVMQLKYRGKSIFLRTYDDAQFWPEEQHFAAAFKRLSNDTIPKIYVSTGNYERSINKLGEREYSLFSVEKLSRNALINRGFEFDTVNLNRQDIPGDAMALVLADPKVELSAPMSNRLRNYVNRGGNLLVYGEPKKQEVLNPLLKPMGVSLMPGTLVQISANESPDRLVPYMSMDYTWLITPTDKRMNTFRNDFRNGDSVKTAFHGAAAVSFADSGFKYNRLWVSRPPGVVWAKAGEFITDSLPPVMDVSLGDYKLDSFNAAIALERPAGNKIQRIVVSGDADHNSNVRSGSQRLSSDYLGWMTHGCFPVRIPDRVITDNLMTIGLTAAKTQKIILLYVLPGALLILGAILLMRRKRQ